MLIDDFSNPDGKANLGTSWRGVSDQVMGGVSVAAVTRTTKGGQSCLRLSGDVSLENNGGFIQASLDLQPTGAPFDASSYTGIKLIVSGNDERYAVHLRTPDNVRPWQSYRAPFTATSQWESIELPFSNFVAHRLETPLDTSQLRRIGLVAIGRAFNADLLVREVSFLG